MNMRRISKWALLVVSLSACSNSQSSGKNPGATSCPRDGVVLADARDVERDAEGVSYSVFGEYPTREADWKRAGAVLSLLKDVWSSTNQKCADLPSGVTTSIDDALSTLDTTIPAEDQEGSARAANDVHLQMTDLFGYFRPEIPVEIVRMDATFLRAGIDAHFGGWPAFDDDLAALKADWSTVRAMADAKVASCHRVAGSQTVVGDLDQTLDFMTAASSSMDTATSETESDAGLLEVDILELLFDCPIDGEPPSAGLGAACAADADCDTDEVCDAANSGGRCAPDPATTNVGEPCATTIDCGTDPRDACNNEAGDGYPGGYCAMEPCNDVQVCSPGATCVSLPFETPSCMKSCEADAECRTKEGYVCQLFPSAPPSGFGPTDHACAFSCMKDEDCTSPLKCDVSSGKCTP